LEKARKLHPDKEIHGESPSKFHKV
jgi:hypothetical protein